MRLGCGQAGEVDDRQIEFELAAHARELRATCLGVAAERRAGDVCVRDLAKPRMKAAEAGA